MKKTKKITNKELERRIKNIEEDEPYNHNAGNNIGEVEVFEIDEEKERVYYSCKVYHDQEGNYEYFNNLYASFESLGVKVEDIQHLL